MRKDSLLFFIIYFLASCSNGKIVYERTKYGCLEIPNRIFNPYKVAMPDSIRMSDIANEEKMIIEDSIRLMASGNENLINLFSNQEQLKRESESAYLINTSASDIITFTVKITLNDRLKTNSTQIFKTNPGEKVFIGCHSYVNDEREVVKQDYEIV